MKFWKGQPVLIRGAWFVAGMCFILMLMLAQANAATLIFVSDFETGAIQATWKNPDGWSKQNGDLPNATVVKCPTLPASTGVFTSVPKPRSGKCMVEFNLVRAEWDGTPGVLQGTVDKPRAQLLKKADGPIGYKQHIEYWFGVSTFHPTDWQFDTNTDNQTVFWEAHGAGGATGRSPALPLTLRGKELTIVNRSGDMKIRPDPNNPNAFVNAELWRGELELGKWTDWVVRMRFSQTGTDGYVQVWRNGVLIAERMNKPTLYYTGTPNTNDMAFQLLTLYKGRFASFPSSVKKNTMYYDSVRIAEGPDGKDLVDPAKNQLDD